MSVRGGATERVHDARPKVGRRGHAKIGSRPSRGTIGAHLVVLVALQLIFVLGLIAYAGIQDFRTARREATQATSTAAELAADFVSGQVEEEASTLDLIPEFAGLISSPGVCQFASQDFDEPDENPGIKSEFLLLRPDGSRVCPGPEGTPQGGYGDADWFKQAVSTNEVTTAGPFVDPVSGKYAMVFAINVSDESTVVAMLSDLSSIVPAMDQKFDTDSVDMDFLVSTADSTTTVSSPGDKGPRSLAGSGFARSDSETFDNLAGEEHIFARAETINGWHVYAGISTSDAVASATEALRERALLAGLIVLLVFAAAVVLQRRFVRPIRGLLHVTRKFAAGDLKAKVRPGGPVELTQLGESLNEMLDVRAESEKAVRSAYRTEKRAASKLREVDAIRNAFLMAISHELRTPLTSVVGYSQLLEAYGDTLSPEERATSISAIAKQSKRLERLLVDLLDVERLSRGTIEPNILQTEVRDVVMRVIEQSAGNGRMKVHISGPEKAYIDPALVERILENLISNAVKHTPPQTKIWVKVSRRNGELHLVVEDSGPGVPDEIKQAIFEPFKQGKVKEHAPGTGVGLSLVAQFSKLHGGRAWVEDRKGGGASFHVVISAKKPSGKMVKEVPPIADTTEANNASDGGTAKAQTNGSGGSRTRVRVGS